MSPRIGIFLSAQHPPELAPSQIARDCCEQVRLARSLPSSSRCGRPSPRARRELHVGVDDASAMRAARPLVLDSMRCAAAEVFPLLRSWRS